MKFLGHVMRNGELENLAMTGKIEGRRLRVLWMSNFNLRMAGGLSRCKRSGDGVTGDGFNQRIEAGHDRPSRRIWHIEREREY